MNKKDIIALSTIITWGAIDHIFIFFLTVPLELSQRLNSIEIVNFGSINAFRHSFVKDNNYAARVILAIIFQEYKTAQYNLYYSS